jgi:hypothetical protein
MKTPKLPSFLQSSLLLVAMGCFFAGCDDMTRFNQERYECGYNRDGLVEIDLREFKEGSQVTVTFTDGPVTMSIVESNDDRFTLAGPGLVVRIDREVGTIRLTRGSHYHNVKCTKSKFRM